MNDIEGIKQVLRVLKPHWNKIEKDFERHNARFLGLTAADHDAIGRVLKAHLVIESFLTSYLQARLGVEDLARLKLSFFQKASLLPLERSSAAFVRPGILQLNAVRNKFGHRLEHKIESHEISAISEALAVARRGSRFNDPIEAIEAFAPVACAFLSVPPPELQELFMQAFAEVRSYDEGE